MNTERNKPTERRMCLTNTKRTLADHHKNAGVGVHQVMLPSSKETSNFRKISRRTISHDENEQSSTTTILGIGGAVEPLRVRPRSCCQEDFIGKRRACSFFPKFIESSPPPKMARRATLLEDELPDKLAETTSLDDCCASFEAPTSSHHEDHIPDSPVCVSLRPSSGARENSPPHLVYRPAYEMIDTSKEQLPAKLLLPDDF